MLGFPSDYRPRLSRRMTMVRARHEQRSLIIRPHVAHAITSSTRVRLPGTAIFS